jgi:hypothetical protein
MVSHRARSRGKQWKMLLLKKDRIQPSLRGLRTNP